MQIRKLSKAVIPIDMVMIERAFAISSWMWASAINFTIPTVGATVGHSGKVSGCPKDGLYSQLFSPQFTYPNPVEKEVSKS